MNLTIKNTLLLISCCTLLQGLVAQQNALQFKFLLQEHALKLGQNVYIKEIKDSVQVDRLQLYIGQVAFWKAGTEVYRLEQKYFLLDAAAPESLDINYPASVDFDQIRFQFGVDSLTNVGGAQGGALDPTQGMYWAWQSGYINFKLEGQTPICPARNNRFQYHIGGFLAPFETVQTVSLPIQGTKGIGIQLALEELFSHLDMAAQYQIMSPRKEAVQVAEIIADLFKVVYED